MPLELGLIHRDVLDRRRRNTGLMGDDPIHQGKGVAVGEKSCDLLAGEENLRCSRFGQSGRERQAV